MRLPPTHLVRKAIEYFTVNKARMDYPAYAASGLPLGSGIVESSCRLVSGLRVKQPGMRWSLSGVQAILSLRALHLSQTSAWDAFWCRQRGYLPSFGEGALPLSPGNDGGRRPSLAGEPLRAPGARTAGWMPAGGLRLPRPPLTSQGSASRPSPPFRPTTRVNAIRKSRVRTAVSNKCGNCSAPPVDSVGAEGLDNGAAV